MTYLEVEENTISPTPCLALADDDCGHSYMRENYGQHHPDAGILHPQSVSPLIHL